MSDEMLRERQTASELIFDGKILHLYRDDIALPDGKPAERELIRHVGAVCVIPICRYLKTATCCSSGSSAIP